jgi:ATP-dependent exoDNAse (exonuclease V) alpha subunit
LLGKLDRGEITLSWKDVIVMDEAGMVGTRPGAPVERDAEEAGAKVIEIGDRRQLQSVLAGGEVHGAWERLGGLRLTEVVRQRDAEERRALGQLHACNVGAYMRFAEIGPVSEQCVRDQRKVLTATMAESRAEDPASEMLELTQERGRSPGREL